MRMRFLILLLVSLASAQALSQSFALHDGDRVVFYGDSITAQRLYTRFIEDMVLTRYPGMHLQFWNAGVPGDSVNGGYAGDAETRLKRDLFPHSPTVVTIMLGMNDGGYGTFHQDWFEGFSAGYRKILNEIDTQLPGVRVTIIKPSPYDEITHGTEFPGYNSVLTRYADQVGRFAAEPHRTLADFNGPITQLLLTAKRENPSLAQLLLPDRIHPSESAHWVMAATLARAWGMTPVVSSVHLDAAKSEVIAARNAKVTDFERSSGALRWVQADQALPLPLNLNDGMMQFVLKISDLTNIDQQILQVSGLNPANYALKIDTKKVATFTGEQLAAGVNLALYPTPMESQARDVDYAEQRRTKLDEARFMLTGEGLRVAGTAEAAKTLDLAQDEMAREQRENARPKSHTFELVPE